MTGAFLQVRISFQPQTIRKPHNRRWVRPKLEGHLVHRRESDRFRIIHKILSNPLLNRRQLIKLPAHGVNNALILRRRFRRSTLANLWTSLSALFAQALTPLVGRHDRNNDTNRCALRLLIKGHQRICGLDRRIIKIASYEREQKDRQFPDARGSKIDPQDIEPAPQGLDDWMRSHTATGRLQRL